MSEKVRGTLSIDTMVDDLAALMDALGITGRIALAGIAVGGAIALHGAARLPGRISAVVVGSPATGIAVERRAAVLARVDRLEREGLRGAVDDSMANGYAPELRTDPERFSAFRARWLGNDPASYAAIYRMLAGMDLQGELAGIRCPVLVLGGALDRVRPPALVEPVARAIPGARYRVLQTGHYMSVATPELVADAIGGFLDEVGA
jgi:3-oxoadipate enol-lactonase